MHSTGISKFPPNDIITLLDQNLAFNLAESTAEDLCLGDVLDAEALRELLSTKLGYGSSRGDASVRHLLAAKLGVGAEQVLLTNGAAAGIFLAVFCLCGPGDEVVTVTPNFPPTLDVIAAVGATRVTVEAPFELGYQIRPEQVAAVLNEKTKLLVLVSPHNPSGTVLPAQVISDIVALAARQAPQAYVLIDETYREATYGTDSVVPSRAAQTGRVLTAASLSKCHGAPGLRLGWLTCPDPQLLEQLTLAKMNTVISGPPLTEQLAEVVLRKEGPILAHRRQLLAACVSLVEEWVAAHHQLVEWVRPQAGALCCVRLRPEVFDETQVEQFYQALPAHELQLAAGEWFGQPRRIFRLGFGFLPPEQLSRALAQLSKVLVEIQAARR